MLNPDEWAAVCGDSHSIAQWGLAKLGIEWFELSDESK